MADKLNEKFTNVSSSALIRDLQTIRRLKIHQIHENGLALGERSAEVSVTVLIDMNNDISWSDGEDVSRKWASGYRPTSRTVTSRWESAKVASTTSTSACGQVDVSVASFQPHTAVSVTESERTY